MRVLFFEMISSLRRCFCTNPKWRVPCYAFSNCRCYTRGEVIYYNLGKFSQLISDFEQIYFQSNPQEKYRSFAGYLRYQADGIYPEGWLEARYVMPNAACTLSRTPAAIPSVASSPPRRKQTISSVIPDPTTSSSRSTPVASSPGLNS